VEVGLHAFIGHVTTKFIVACSRIHRIISVCPCI